MKRKLAQIKRFFSKKFQNVYSRTKTSGQRIKVYRQKIFKYIDSHPLKSFFIALGIVLLLIVISNFLPKPQPEVIKNEAIKHVEVYHIGTAPKITVQAQIKKSGVIQINAQAAGIVNFIHAYEGTKISKGSPLINIANNYFGGNAASIKRQMSQQQYDNVQAEYQPKKEIIQKNKDLANKADENSDQLRDIAAKAHDDTRALITYNQQLLEIQEQVINDPTSTDLEVSSARSAKSSLLNALNQARSALRSSEYDVAKDKPPAQISDITREKAIKELELQEKQLDLNKEITHLQLLIDQVNESIYYPAAPFSGVVERVFVKPFEQVNPGTPLMILSQTKEEDPITAVAFVSKDIANRASLVEESILHIDNTEISVKPSFISTEAVQGSLYAIYYPIPDELTSKLTNEGFISVDIPVGYPDSLSSIPFVPIDAVYQTRSAAYLFVVDNDLAKSKEVTLGQVYGRFVEVTAGIAGSDAVILNRNVIEGDKIQTN